MLIFIELCFDHNLKKEELYILKLLSLFSGIGAFEKALKRSGIKYELVSYCEKDKFASRAYSLIHNVNENLNLGDITKVDKSKIQDFDLMTWGFPCQDISIAGDQRGIVKGETRSGLYYEGLEVLKLKKPKYSIIENVKNLIGKRFREQFKQMLIDLEKEGYNNYWKVLNAKDFGIPQNRERVFIISIRKDVDDGMFEFPDMIDSKTRLRDLLEDEVDEKYYINIKKAKGLIDKLSNKEFSNSIRTSGRGSLDRHQWDLVLIKHKVMVVGNINPSGKGINGNVISDLGLCSTITTNKGEGLKLLQIGLLDTKGNEQTRRVYHQDGISPTLNSMQGGNRQPKVLLIEKNNNYYAISIRKLTPLECFRLMGFDDKDYYILKENKISNSQLYKMAGNSIVVNVLEHIFCNLLN